MLHGKQAAVDLFEKVNELNADGLDLYAYEDISLHEVVRRLNNMGLKPRKNQEWTVASIKDILANPVYIGKEIVI